MPTAARLAGAIFFGALAYYICTLTVPLFPEGSVPKNWYMFNIIIGILTGWVTVGPRSGEGFVAAFGVGITGAVVMAFWVLFAHSFRDMIRESFRKVYDSAIEAIVDIFGIMIDDYIYEIGNTEVVVTLLAGGIIAGLATDYFAKRFR